jgi:ubiquinone/menaquinone biosynthesis C-methylase UbiE
MRKIIRDIRLSTVRKENTVNTSSTFSDAKVESFLPYGQREHDALLSLTHEDQSRQEFVRSLKRFLATNVAAGNRELYDNCVRPQFMASEGREPANRTEVRTAMESEVYYQTWSALQRTSQEMMWESVGSAVERQLPDMIDRIVELGANALGSLQLDEQLQIPAYHKMVDIHCMPGGYHTEVAKNDVAAGAVFDRGVYIYAMGQLGPLNDDMGMSLAKHIVDSFPDFEPKRILDMGCGAGFTTLPYCDVFPDAEVFGIDVAAPLLRYGHGRASALGKKAHFSQQNAEQTDFPDGYFDLVVSHILLHETSRKAIANIMGEAHRVLAPHGLTLHSEAPEYEGLSPYEAFALDWDTHYNNEPFWGTVREMNLKNLMTNAGFSSVQLMEETIPSDFESDQPRRQVFEGGDFGGGGAWFVFGGWK